MDDLAVAKQAPRQVWTVLDWQRNDHAIEHFVLDLRPPVPNLSKRN